MARSRNVLISLAAVALVVALAALGWQMMRMRDAPAPSVAAPTTLPAPAAPPREQGTGTARLSWAPIKPGAPGAGVAADPIAGFRVYVGPSPDAMRLEASIEDPTATGYVVERLPKGTFYYSVTTYTKLGIESEKPEPVSKTIE